MQNPIASRLHMFRYKRIIGSELFRSENLILFELKFASYFEDKAINNFFRFNLPNVF